MRDKTELKTRFSIHETYDIMDTAYGTDYLKYKGFTFAKTIADLRKDYNIFEGRLFQVEADEPFERDGRLYCSRIRLVKEIFYMRNEEVLQDIVSVCGDDIQYINNPSIAIQKIAVQQNGLSVRFIKNPSEKIRQKSCKKKWISFTIYR